MEPVWRLSESVPLAATFSLAESFRLDAKADAFIWSDFLGEPLWLYSISDLSGRFTARQSLSGRFTSQKNISGQYVPEQRIEGDA